MISYKISYYDSMISYHGHPLAPGPPGSPQGVWGATPPRAQGGSGGGRHAPHFWTEIESCVLFFGAPTKEKLPYGNPGGSLVSS